MMIDAQKLKSGLNPVVVSIDHHLESGSTNDLIKSAAGDLGAGQWALVVTEQQNEGRGRRGTTWVSAAGESLTWSMATALRLPAEVWPRASLVVGRALLEQLGAADLRLKWPNDLLLMRDGEKPRKVAGVLCERHERPGDAALWVVGIGLNLRRPQQPADVAALSAGLDETELTPDPTALVAALSDAVISAVNAWTAREGRLDAASFDHNLAFRDSAVTLEFAPNQTEDVWLLGLTDTGQLRVQDLDVDGNPSAAPRAVEPWRLLGAH